VKDVIAWAGLPGGKGRVVTAIAADRDHLDLVSAWWRSSPEPDAWTAGDGPARLASLTEGRVVPGARSWIVLLGGLPLGYLETSELGDTPLERALVVAGVDVSSDDVVWPVHLDPSDLATETTRQLIARSLLASALLASGVGRVFVPLAPDEDARRATCATAGMSEVAAVQVDGRDLVVLGCDRAAFVAAWPADMASVQVAEGSLTDRSG